MLSFFLVQNNGFKRNQFSRPVREAVASRESSTTDLMARTDELLEKRLASCDCVCILDSKHRDNTKLLAKIWIWIV